MFEVVRETSQQFPAKHTQSVKGQGTVQEICC